MLNVDWNNVLISLEIMWKGMAGIFISTILIIAMATLLSKFTSGKKDNSEEN